MLCLSDYFMLSWFNIAIIDLCCLKGLSVFMIELTEKVKSAYLKIVVIEKKQSMVEHFINCTWGVHSTDVSASIKLLS